MQRRINPTKLQENFYGTLFPKPTVRAVDMSTLDGGLNLWELPYRMDKNQSPDCVNVYWKDGCLRSRPGQKILFDVADNIYIIPGFHRCYERLWHGYVIAHIGKGIYAINPYDHTDYKVLRFNISDSDVGPGFFVFNNILYCVVGGTFIAVDSSFNVSNVLPDSGLTPPTATAFVPTVVMNMQPNGTGGTSYQPENRLSPKKKLLYTSDGTSTDYYLPYKGITAGATEVRVDVYDAGTQTYSWQTLVEITDFTVDTVNGVVSFTNPPAQENPENPNNVEITISKTNVAAMKTITEATCLQVYGGDTDLTVVVGGSSSQPNAYYWSGNTHLSIDPTYFPMDYYNLAGADASNKITGFGRQQGMLIIFQEHSIGKSHCETVTVEDRVMLTLNYTNINSEIGCDASGSIQLVNNNLVFANSYSGVYVLANTTTADENNVKRVSKNINGNSVRGILGALATASVVTSFDDDERYWLIIDGDAYVWDYTLKSYLANEENLSWFYFTNINAHGVYEDETSEHFYFDEDGSIVQFTPRAFNDFNEAIERKYTFAVQNFGTYEGYKDVMKVVFAVRSDTRSYFDLSYKTDWENYRLDRTPIYAAPPEIVMVPYNLTDGYDFRSDVYAGWATRIPRCFHIQHFGMTVFNNTINTDIGLVSAQIFYRYVRNARESHGVR